MTRKLTVTKVLLDGQSSAYKEALETFDIKSVEQSMLGRGIAGSHGHLRTANSRFYRTSSLEIMSLEGDRLKHRYFFASRLN